MPTDHPNIKNINRIQLTFGKLTVESLNQPPKCIRDLLTIYSKKMLNKQS